MQLAFPVIAILQGVVALIGYLIFGVKEPWFWFVVTCITAMLPVVGAALAYVPLAIIFFANWRYRQRNIHAHIRVWSNRYSR
jgi:predicted PurR-regulated permease PerM